MPAVVRMKMPGEPLTAPHAILLARHVALHLQPPAVILVIQAWVVLQEGITDMLIVLLGFGGRVPAVLALAWLLPADGMTNDTKMENSSTFLIHYFYCLVHHSNR